MDNGYSRHMIDDTLKFLSLRAQQGGGMPFGGGKKGSILGIGRIERFVNNSIYNVYYVEDLKCNLLIVSQICDKGNDVKFMVDKCMVTNCVTKRVVMSAARVKNMYVSDLDSIERYNLSFLSAQPDANLSHRRLGHVSISLPNKLVSRNMVNKLLNL